MRELILARIKETIIDSEYIDEEFIQEIGSFEEVLTFDDKKLLDAYDFLIAFRG